MYFYLLMNKDFIYLFYLNRNSLPGLVIIGTFQKRASGQQVPTLRLQWNAKGENR